jgi:hypothetical protein
MITSIPEDDALSLTSCTDLGDLHIYDAASAFGPSASNDPTSTSSEASEHHASIRLKSAPLPPRASAKPAIQRREGTATRFLPASGGRRAKQAPRPLAALEATARAEAASTTATPTPTPPTPPPRSSLQAIVSPAAWTEGTRTVNPAANDVHNLENDETGASVLLMSTSSTITARSMLSPQQEALRAQLGKILSPPQLKRTPKAHDAAEPGTASVHGGNPTSMLFSRLNSTESTATDYDNLQADGQQINSAAELGIGPMSGMNTVLEDYDESDCSFDRDVLCSPG